MIGYALLVYSVAAFGLAYVVGHAVISRPIREWLDRLGVEHRQTWALWVLNLLECPACFGFWTGIGAAVVLYLLAPVGWPLPPSWLGLATLACYTAGSNFALARATGLTTP